MMRVNDSGRTYEPGKALSDDFRRAIVDEIIKRGGNIVTGDIAFPIANIARHRAKNMATIL